jgi:hypothetical protein
LHRLRSSSVRILSVCYRHGEQAVKQQAKNIRRKTGRQPIYGQPRCR